MTTQLKRQRIVLDIVYGANEKTVAPADWEWWRILDGHDLEAASAVLSTEVVEMEKTEGGALLSICDTPRFAQIDAPELLGTVGVLQRVVGTQDRYVLHGKSVCILPGNFETGGVLIEHIMPDEVVVSFSDDAGKTSGTRYLKPTYSVEDKDNG